jgi:hypothetical protein
MDYCEGYRSFESKQRMKDKIIFEHSFAGK